MVAQNIKVVAQNIKFVTQIVITETRNAAMVAASAAGLLYVIGVVAQGVAKQHKFIQDCFPAHQFQLSVQRNIYSIKT
jgi:uncharacterized membrane protein